MSELKTHKWQILYLIAMFIILLMLIGIVNSGELFIGALSLVPLSLATFQIVLPRMWALRLAIVVGPYLGLFTYSQHISIGTVLCFAAGLVITIMSEKEEDDIKLRKAAQLARLEAV